MKRIGLGTIFALLMSLAVFSYGRQAGQDPGGANQEPPNNHQEVQPPPRAPEMTPPRGQQEAKPPKLLARIRKRGYLNGRRCAGDLRSGPDGAARRRGLWIRDIANIQVGAVGV
jgi:hypothetical protein